ncbi:MAG: nitroreductase family protein [Candidatus Zixiibacteriota bacterium]|jgi:FMN reductase [NAD(P)H]
MGLYDLLMRRRSVRNFENRPIPDDVIDKLVRAANNAPTGGNMQPLSIILVQEAERRARLAEMVGNQPWVKNAPLTMIFCLDFWRLKKWAAQSGVDFRGNEALSHSLIGYADVICAAQTAVVLAEELGLGSVYVGSIQYVADEAREYFDIPEYVFPVLLLSLGYAKTVPRGVTKLATEIVVHRERYRTPDDEEIRRAFDDKYGSLDENVEKYFERVFVEAVEADKQETPAWVEKYRERMSTLGIKNNAEFLFKLRYPSDMMVELNAEEIETWRKAGFDCFGPG